MGPLGSYSVNDYRNPSLPVCKTLEINKLLISDNGAVVFLKHHSRGIIKLTISLKPSKSISISGECENEIRDLLSEKLPSFRLNPV